MSSCISTVHSFRFLVKSHIFLFLDLLHCFLVQLKGCVASPGSGQGLLLQVAMAADCAELLIVFVCLVNPDGQSRQASFSICCALGNGEK